MFSNSTECKAEGSIILRIGVERQTSSYWRQTDPLLQFRRYQWNAINAIGDYLPPVRSVPRMIQLKSELGSVPSVEACLDRESSIDLVKTLPQIRTKDST